MSSSANIFAKWQALSLLWKIVIVNIAIFLAIRIALIVDMVSGSHTGESIVEVLVLPANSAELLERPWTLLTYMFTQYDIPHILFNMLTFYCFGVLLTYRCAPSRLMALYIYGGMAGAVLFLVSAAIWPAAITAPLIGSSASVISIVVATALLMPDFSLRMFLIGNVRLKWIALTVVVLLLLGSVGTNGGGLAAHLGGIATGAIFGFMLRFKNVDITRPAVNAWSSFTAAIVRLWNILKPAKKKRAKGKFKNVYTGHTPLNEIERRRKLDEILDKIKKSGYSALTADEKRFLFSESSKL